MTRRFLVFQHSMRFADRNDIGAHWSTERFGILDTRYGLFHIHVSTEEETFNIVNAWNKDVDSISPTYVRKLGDFSYDMSLQSLSPKRACDLDGLDENGMFKYTIQHDSGECTEVQTKDFQIFVEDERYDS